MTTIIVKPAKENAKTRRYRQRGELMAKRREDAALALKISKAWAKLTYIDRPVVDTPVYDDMDNCCLPQVSLFKAGYRKSDSVTAR